MTTQTEREMLELAALAAGLRICLWRDGIPSVTRDDTVSWTWHHLTDDGDEARLEAALMIDVRWWPDDVTAGVISEMYVDHGFDKQKARRYAGTRAAAEIGRQMKEKQ